MGEMEKRARSRKKKQDIRKAILTTIGAAGVIALALAAPNTLRLLRFAPGMRSQFRSRTRRSLDRLIKGGYVRQAGNGKQYLELSAKGKLLLARFSSGTQKNNIQKSWDKKWRIVIFDIPESRAIQRAHLRNMLQNIGFRMLQASVWVYPYDCEDFVQLLKTGYALGKEVLYIIADDIEGDRALREHFGLAR